MPSDTCCMRIANWNVERPSLKSPKNALRVDHLLNLKADLVVLTETSTAVDLGPDYVGIHTNPSPRKPREGEAVAAIWVRASDYHIIQSVVTSDPREAVCVELDCRLGPLLVYASIIPYDRAKGVDGDSGRWVEHKRAIQWHRDDWLRLRSKYPRHQIITAGDYNQHRDGVGSYGTRETRGALSDALREAGLTCVTQEDFVATGKLSRPNMDHVCMTSRLADNVQAVDAWEGTIKGKRLSDHNGIVVDVDCRDLELQQNNAMNRSRRAGPL
jgi:exonuclease III